MKKFSIAWLTTNRTCNNRCKWCYARNTLNSRNIMSLEEAKLAVDELKRRGVKRIVLIGGEPTIYPYFFELISYISSKEIEVAVPTNGRKFKDKKFAEKARASGLNSVDISIKAIDETSYFNSTNTYGLNEMLQGYRNLKEVGVKVTTSYVITNNQEKDFDLLIEFLKRERITNIGFQFVKPVLSLKKTEEVMSIAEMGRFVEYIYHKMKNSGISYSVEISFPICLIDQNVFENLAKEGKIINCCHVPKGNGINLDENFKYMPCNHFAEFPFSDEPIKWDDPDMIDDIVNSETVKNFRKLARCFPTIKCQKCEKWNICGGGCFTRWLTINPNDYIK